MQSCSSHSFNTTRQNPQIFSFLSGKCQNACNGSTPAAQYVCLYVLWRSDMDTMTHVSAGTQQVFLATCSCVCVHVCVCCVSSHLAAVMPALRMCGIGLRNNLFLSVSMCLSPLDPSFPSLSLFLPNAFHPPVSLHPSFVYRTLLSISLHLSSLPSFHPSLHPGASSVTFYL